MKVINTYMERLAFCINIFVILLYFVINNYDYIHIIEK